MVPRYPDVGKNQIGIVISDASSNQTGRACVTTGNCNSTNKNDFAFRCGDVNDPITVIIERTHVVAGNNVGDETARNQSVVTIGVSRNNHISPAGINYVSITDCKLTQLQSDYI